MVKSNNFYTYELPSDFFYANQLFLDERLEKIRSFENDVNYDYIKRKNPINIAGVIYHNDTLIQKFFIKNGKFIFSIVKKNPSFYAVDGSIDCEQISLRWNKKPNYSFLFVSYECYKK